MKQGLPGNVEHSVSSLIMYSSPYRCSDLARFCHQGTSAAIISITCKIVNMTQRIPKDEPVGLDAELLTASTDLTRLSTVFRLNSLPDQPMRRHSTKSNSHTCLILSTQSGAPPAHLVPQIPWFHSLSHTPANPTLTSLPPCAKNSSKTGTVHSS